MSMWNKFKSFFKFGKKEEIKNKKVDVKITRLKETMDDTVLVDTEEKVDTFLEESNKFKSTLNKNKKAYLSRLIKDYVKAINDEDKNKAKSKVERYISKNK